MVVNGFAVAAAAAGLLVFAVVAFFMLRELFTWYWKQSEQVELLRSIDATLKALAEQRRPAPAAPAAPALTGWSSVPASMSPAPAPSRP